jgi:hypothetical protein
MSIWSDIKAVFAPHQPQGLQQLATGLCVLPAPKVRHVAPPKAKVKDMYVIDPVTATYGFHTATAQKQQDGSIDQLTGYDLEVLKERGYWGKERAVQAKNAACKAHWHHGKTEKEAAALLGCSVSWVEKRYGSFSTALLEEGKPE